MGQFLIVLLTFGCIIFFIYYSVRPVSFNLSFCSVYYISISSMILFIKSSVYFVVCLGKEADKLGLGVFKADFNGLIGSNFSGGSSTSYDMLVGISLIR